MNKTENRNDFGTYITLQQAASEINAGTATARKVADESGAVVHIGKCYRINREIFLDYVHSKLAQ